MRGAKFLLPALLVLLMAYSARADDRASLVQEKIDWPHFLARHDMLWTQPPTDWRNSPFIGNGELGAMLWVTRDGALSWRVGDTGVWDHRTPTQGVLNPSFDRCRLPLGQFVIHPRGKIVSVKMRLNLWDAELTGTITTSEGTIELRNLAHAVEPVLLLYTKTTGGESQFSWEWVPDISRSPRADPAMRRHPPVGYVGNPPSQTLDQGDIKLCAQPMSAGGEYVTAVQEKKIDDAQRQFTLSVGYTTDGTGDRAQAVKAIETAAAESENALTASHQAWWHAFYPESFLSIPHTQLEGLYWTQMYKFASATRAGRALDLYGPWNFPTPWPYICWNMNEQVEYSPVYTANRLELGESLCRMLENHVAELRSNVPPAFRADCAALPRASAIDCAGPVPNEIGDLPWALHNFWRQCRWAGDDARLRDKFYPLLKLAINYYQRQLIHGPDGKLHLPKTFSPEYGVAPDCNYDISLLHWGLMTLIETAQKFKLDPAKVTEWKATLANLTDYPQDPANGYMIGAGVPLAHAHRHYSHLMMIFPLRIVNWEQPENHDIIEKSVNYWLNVVPGPDRLGFTYLGAASMHASMDRGDDALADLQHNLDHVIYPNTMYAESCIESPLGMCESLQDMLLHTLNPAPGTGRPAIIRVFPAVPAAWADVSFHHLRAEGGFLVSGVRSGGKTQWVSIQSLAGEPCLIRPGFDGDFQVRGASIQPEKISDGLYRLPLKKGDEVVLTSGARDFTVAPVAGNPAQENFYGLHGKERRHDQPGG